MAATPDGHGYWLVAADGGIFAFGDAGFYGSTGAMHLNAPIVGMTANPNGHGYWFVAADGGIFAFGDAPFYGSLGDVPQSRPIVAMAADSAGNGYWFTNSNGAVTPFGNANYSGSAPQVLNQPIVGMAQADANGQFADAPYPAGSMGYDISNYQCPPAGSFPPEPHVIGIVQVEGSSLGAVNPCLSAEAAWAGGGLNLYVYLTFGQTGSSPDAACNSGAFPYNGSATACDYGFEHGRRRLPEGDECRSGHASVAGGSTSKTRPSPPTRRPARRWSKEPSTGSAISGSTTSAFTPAPRNWSNFVGTSYRPNVPYWVADWGPSPATTCTEVHSSYGDIPSGPVQIVQYASNTYDEDYAC